MNEKPDAVSVIFIAASPEKIWRALLDRTLSRDYFFGMTLEIEPKVGGRFTVRRPDGSLDDEGEVLVFDPPSRLTLNWRVSSVKELRDLPPVKVDFHIEDCGGASKVTVSEFGRAGFPESVNEGARVGWAYILSALKTIVETGAPLPAADWSAAA